MDINESKTRNLLIDPQLKREEGICKASPPRNRDEIPNALG